MRGNPQALFGKRPTEKDPAKGTSPAVDFTRRAGRGNPPGAILAGRPGPTQLGPEISTTRAYATRTRVSTQPAQGSYAEASATPMEGAP